MSILKLLKKRCNVRMFTTPSHSQRFFVFNKIRNFYKYDISETDCYDPQTALLFAERKATKIYHTQKTKFLTNGSTSGIIAAVLSCVKPNEQVLIWKNAHPCHKNAVALACAIPVYYDIELDEEWGIPKKTSPALIEEYLKSNKISAVIVTSPTYEGFVSDIKSIKDICTKYGAYLIVDEAHGALYPFSDRLPKSSVEIADFTIQSLHKTAGGLNPTALLHTNTNINVDTYLNKINTTSPSYPLLASIEANINFLNSKKGKKQIDNLIDEIIKLKAACPFCKFGGDDVTKLLIKMPNMSGLELSEKLYENNIEDEKTNNTSTMLLCGIGTTKTKLLTLRHTLKKISKINSNI